MALFFHIILVSFQYIYREGRSTDTTYYLVNGIKAQLKAKDYVLGVFIDIEKVFDSISNKSIKEANTISAALVNWTQDMLTDRNLTVSFDDATIRGHWLMAVRRGRFFLLCCDV